MAERINQFTGLPFEPSYDGSSESLQNQNKGKQDTKKALEIQAQVTKQIEDGQISQDIKHWLQDKGFYNFRFGSQDTIFINTNGARVYYVHIRPASKPTGIMPNEDYVPVTNLEEFKEWFNKDYDSKGSVISWSK